MSKPEFPSTAFEEHMGKKTAGFLDKKNKVVLYLSFEMQTGHT